jgi:hypothetical protein
MVGAIDRRRTRQKPKVIELGLQDRVFEEMKKPDFTVTNLAKQLQDEGYDISEISLRRFINKSKDLQKQYIKNDIREASKFKDIAIDYKTTIKEIIDEIKDVRKNCLTEKEYQAYSNLVGRLFQGLELLAKITGELNKTSNVDVKIIYQEINNRINEEAKKHKKYMFRDVIDVDSLVQEQDEKVAKEIRGDESDD